MTQFTNAARSATRALRELFPETPLQRNDHLCQQFLVSSFKCNG
jgi:threonine dehydratase